MSYGPHLDAGLENPLAVHIRNFPVSLLVQDKYVLLFNIKAMHYKRLK
jgi:hypothetical protein